MSSVLACDVLPSRIRAKLVVTERGCWEWTAATNAKGYGITSLQSKPWLAHRVVRTLIAGPITPGMMLCHHCDTRRCCNPEHLFEGTNADNSADRDRKGRTARGPVHRERMRRVAARGERHRSRTKPESVPRGEQNNAKLRNQDVLAIREEHARGGVTYVAIARRYGISSEPRPENRPSTEVGPLMNAVLAVDPSLSGTAVVVATACVSAVDTIAQRFVTKPASGVLARVHRYRSIAEPILALARAHTPRLVLIEGYSFGSKGGQSFDRAELGGILRDRLCDIAPVLEVPPTSLKKWATGKGNAQKAEVVSAVSRRFDRSFTTDDEADAFALAMLGLAILAPSEWASMPKAQLEVASKLSAEAHTLVDAFERALRGAA